jgi:hypothetical protein
MEINMYDFILCRIFYYIVPVVTHVFKSEDINIVLATDIPIVNIVCWYNTLYQVEPVVWASITTSSRNSREILTCRQNTNF